MNKHLYKTNVAQLILIQMDGAAAEPYAGKYNGQTDATPSKMAEDKDTIKADHDPIRGTFVTPDIQDHDFSKDSPRTIRDYCKTQYDCGAEKSPLYRCPYFNTYSWGCIVCSIDQNVENLNDEECDLIDAARGLIMLIRRVESARYQVVR